MLDYGCKMNEMNRLKLIIIGVLGTLMVIVIILLSPYFILIDVRSNDFTIKKATKSHFEFVKETFELVWGIEK